MADEQEPKTTETDEKPDEGSGKETDWKAMARKWEKRAKENSEKAKAFDDAQEANKSDLQKAKDEAAALKKQLADYKAKAVRDEARAKVAQETGVPAALIKGADEDEMRDFAQKLAEWKKPQSAPKAKKPGKFADNAGDDGVDAGKRELARLMFGGSK